MNEEKNNKNEGRDNNIVGCEKAGREENRKPNRLSMLKNKKNYRKHKYLELAKKKILLRTPPKSASNSTGKAILSLFLKSRRRVFRFRRNPRAGRDKQKTEKGDRNG